MVDVHPSYGVGSMDLPNLKQGTSSEGIGQERLGVVLFKKSNKNDFNLFLPLPYVIAMFVNIACPPSIMVTKTASVVDDGRSKYTVRT